METCDLNRFSARELAIAARILRRYARHGADYLNEGVRLCRNGRLNMVYLIDESDRIAMVDRSGRLRQWFQCPNCGSEGFNGGFYRIDGKRRRLEFVRYRGCCSRVCVDAMPKM